MTGFCIILSMSFHKIFMQFLVSLTHFIGILSIKVTGTFPFYLCADSMFLKVIFQFVVTFHV